MKHPIGLRDLSQVARSLKVKKGTVRRWIWKLDIEPAERKRTEFRTARGRRVGFVSLFSRDQVDELRKAMNKEES